MAAADIFRRLPGVFQIDGICGHAHGVGLNGTAQAPGGDSAHQGAVQSAGEQEAHGHIRVQALLHAPNQLLADVGADCLQIIPADLFHPGHIPVADESAVLIVVPRRKRQDPVCQAQQAPGLAGEKDASAFAVPVVQRPDTDGVPGGNEAVCGGVVEDQGKLRVQLREHLRAPLPPQGQQQLAVGASGKPVSLRLQRPLQLPEAVKFAVADHGAAVRGGKRLHPGRLQAHDGQTVKQQSTGWELHRAAVVRPPAFGCREGRLQAGSRNISPRVTHDRTHKSTSR